MPRRLRATRRDALVAAVALLLGVVFGVVAGSGTAGDDNNPPRSAARSGSPSAAAASPTPNKPDSTETPKPTAPPELPSARPAYDSFPTITGPRIPCKRKVSGPFLITKPGTYSGICVTNGDIEIRANDVILTDFSVINTGGYHGSGNLIYVLPGFARHEIMYGRISNDSGFGWGLYPVKDTYAHHLDISGTGDGMQVGINGRYEYLWIHDLTTKPGGHVDGIQLVGGREGNTEIAYSRIEGPFKGQTSAIIVKADLGAIDGVNIHDNYLSGGSYTVYVYDARGNSTTNVRLDRNQFLRGSYIYAALATLPAKSPVTQIVSRTDNVYDDGTPVW